MLTAYFSKDMCHSTREMPNVHINEVQNVILFWGRL